MKVSLFVTCLADTFYPRSAIAVVKVLEHLGCQVEFPQAQTCCGQPMFNTGYRDDARELARRLIATFEHADYVVTPSGSCAAMVREHYAQDLLAGDPAWEPAAAALADKTYEFVEFLIKVLKVDGKALNIHWPGRVTYHYACHLRGLGMTNEAVDLLEQIQGVEHVVLPKREQCCGFGGTFAMKYPDISGAMVRDKVACIRQTQTPTVVSNDSGCTMNIAGACRREGCDVGFTTLAEIMAEGLGLLPKQVDTQQASPADSGGRA